MIEIEVMSRREIGEMLERVNYGHLGCSEEGHPYVVPIHFGYDGEAVYFFTTEGRKTQILDAFPEVCLQIEEVVDKGRWRSVIVSGIAEKVSDGETRARALLAITAENPTLTPAINIQWKDDWVREVRDIEVIYRIEPSEITGRKTA